MTYPYISAKVLHQRTYIPSRNTQALQLSSVSSLSLPPPAPLFFATISLEIIKLKRQAHSCCMCNSTIRRLARPSVKATTVASWSTPYREQLSNEAKKTTWRQSPKQGNRLVPRHTHARTHIPQLTIKLTNAGEGCVGRSGLPLAV